MGVGTHMGEIATVPAGSELWQRFEPYLLRDEKILWVGQPTSRKRLSRSDILFVPFSVVWCGIAVVWETTAVAGGAPPFFMLFGALFVLVGLYLVFGRFFYMAWARRRTFYGVTNQRVLALFRRRSSESLTAAYLPSIPSVNRRLRRDGSGTVIFGNASQWIPTSGDTGLEFLGSSTFTDSGLIAFFDIPDARSVADLVEQLRRDA
jgi:hypothetical protein